ncbi:MAG: hypothetical protein CL908_12065 [Deltaproteobacteria bacterium]|nr:hypothetical protein [Deltaproteobacteria bacterium]
MQSARTHLGLFLPLIACLLVPSPTRSAEIQGNHHPLSEEIEYLSDPAGTLTLEHLLADPSAYPFVAVREGRPDSSFTPVWLKIELDFTKPARAKQYYLFARIENLYEIRLYRPDREGGYTEWVTGNDYPASTRELDGPRYGFLIESSETTQTLYIRYIGGPGANQFPWDLVEKDTYLRIRSAYYSMEVAVFSAITTLLIFNLFIALSLRKAEYFHYSAYVFSVMMGLATLDGLGFYYLWPDFPAFNQRALHSFNLLSSGTRLLTILAFLNVADFAPRLNRAAQATLGLLGVGFLVLNGVGITRLPPYSLTIPWAAGILFGFVVCAYAIWKRVRLAIPLFVALLIPSITAILQAFLTVNTGGISVIELQLAKIGFVVHVLMFSLCLAAQIKVETESRILALHDSLTGLPGTTLLQERFELAANLCRRQGMKTAVIFIDLDGFKAVNDTMGHAAGDQLLVQVAGRIQGELRHTDTVARIGGDEFVVLLTQLTDVEDATQIGEKLLASVAKPYLIDGSKARIGASIGIAVFPDAGEDLESLLEAADGAMYESKRHGKNTCTLASSSVVARPSRFQRIGRLTSNESG